MKSKKIKEEIEILIPKLKDKIFSISYKKTSEMTKLKQPDISMWLNGKRIWSYEKILKIAEKLGL